MEGYRTGARILHWLVALAVLATIPAGWIMIQEGIPRELGNTLFIAHKNGGVLILLAMLVRLAYRARRPAPPLPEGVPGWQRAAARVSHAGLYALLLVMPIAGYVRVRAGGFPIEALDALGLPTLVPRSDALANAAKATHLYASYALVGLILVHIGGAVQHAVWRRDGVVSRMWPPWRAHAAPRARRPSAMG